MPYIDRVCTCEDAPCCGCSDIGASPSYVRALDRKIAQRDADEAAYRDWPLTPATLRSYAEGKAVERARENDKARRDSANVHNAVARRDRDAAKARNAALEADRRRALHPVAPKVGRRVGGAV